MPEYSSVTGLEGVKFAPLKKENGFYVATKIIDYPYAINAKVNTETSTEKQYADNKLVDMAVTTGSTKLELEMRDLPNGNFGGIVWDRRNRRDLYVQKECYRAMGCDVFLWAKSERQESPCRLSERAFFSSG